MEREIIARTPNGDLRGRIGGGISRFLGVPYALAPLGERRFRPPELHPGWSGVRDALERGPNAPQLAGELPQIDLSRLADNGWRQGDDYLTLNVWAPAVAADSRPVMVFIHGGAFTGGSKDAPVTDGSSFARSGVVCVAINYRLGVEGFLPITGGATNLGLRDQIAALAWVRDNIAGFGGDPANVTVFGESAGAMAIADLIASPLAKGLFRRAIVQSGHGGMVRSLDVAKRLTRRLADMLDVPPTVEGFNRRNPGECLIALERILQSDDGLDLREADGRDASLGLSPFLPIWGDDVIPARPLDALANGAGAEIDLLIGTNLEEMNLYYVPTGARAALDATTVSALLARVQPDAAAVLEAYGLGTPGRSPGEVFTDAMHDLAFRWPARRFAETHRGRTHMYEFGWPSPACGGDLGACHALELPFVFDTLETATGPRGLAGEAPPAELARRVHDIWVEFARSGAAPWPEYATTDRQVMRLETGVCAPEPPPPAARHLP